ncbi:cystathionine beta-synthase [Litoribacter ruber]|uniref:cystathionine beta-synthase n=1 Tax=Litoribacter ruber TaxID=702568 RepID=UPI001BDA1EB9|nr:cystathionine beta-synthase [Litoribacter ruber]MBT0810150.1 cystathionine beta-synthase [Litoribacter ruber]
MNKKVLNYIENVLANMPEEWLSLTTHRLDIYNEGLAKTEFLEGLEGLFHSDISDKSALSELPTAFDYIRLGHPLSCIMEWGIGQVNGLKADNVISFSSRTVPVLAILRKNLMLGRDTQIYYTGALPDFFDADAVRQVYGYTFDLNPVQSLMDVTSTEETTVFIANGDNGLLTEQAGMVKMSETVDFYISDQGKLGSLLLVNGEKNESYISEIQHVRRRETISMTPVNSLIALQQLIGKPVSQDPGRNVDAQKTAIQNLVNEITATDAKPLFGSSGLSMQYAIMMGLVHDALVNHPGKGIRFIVPPNCYGGTNDQARRVEACIDNVKVLDLPVDGDNNMVQSIDRVLAQVASDDAVPYIIAEIPTNPRVEVPDLDKLRAALSQERRTAAGATAIDPVFILDQTFCPNVQFLSEEGIFSEIRAISYVSGSKFPSGGKVTAGYCVANRKAEALLEKIEKHLILCDNEATALQVELLAEQLPSMNQRIADAYKNTREYVNFIREVLPQAKINFVSEKLAEEGFTPSVFSLDLPTMGSTHEEREIYKRALNLKLISRMIGEIPNEGKYCVSYGQLKGCYWTIPATSTQGTTKEGDKDYIVRVALSGNMDMELHKRVFMDFVKEEVR